LSHANTARLPAWSAILAALVLCLGLSAPAQGDDREPFAIEDVTVDLEDGVYRLDARIRYRLPDGVREAVTNGVPIVLEVDIDLLRRRGWWWDEQVAGLLQRYRLRYHALTRQYTVTNLNTEAQRTFPTLGSALQALGRLQGLPAFDASLLREGGDYRLRMQARLNVDELPLPLRVRGYLFSDWRPESPWRTWPLP